MSSLTANVCNIRFLAYDVSGVYRSVLIWRVVYAYGISFNEPANVSS